MSILKPRLIPLGDSALLVRFGDTLDAAANKAAVAFASWLDRASPDGVVEITPNLVSVLLRFDPSRTDASRLAGELRVLPPGGWQGASETGVTRTIPIRFDGEDIEEVAVALGFSVPDFIAAHNAAPLPLLATGFAPGFVYCGFHPPSLQLPRRTKVRASVPAGTVLFAAGQTAITATAIPTGWHVIGQTEFRNFDPKADPPTTLAAGDLLRFERML